MAIYDDLYNSGQAFLYVFIAPKANLNTEIMTKRVQQLARLSEMYAADKTYTPAQMIEILRAGIQAKYGKSPELILQIIFDNAVRISKIGSTLDAGNLTYDQESNQYYDGSGNAFILDNSGNVVTKNGQTADLSIETPASLDNVNVGTPGSGSTFWKDVASVIDWIVKLFQNIGLTKPSSTISAYAPGTVDWTKLGTGNSMSSSADITTYLPWVIGAGIVYTLYTESTKKAKTTKTTK